MSRMSDGAVGHRHAQVALEVALLRRADSAWSKITPCAPVASTRALISSALPEPTNSAGSGALRRATTRATGTSPADCGQQGQFVERGVEARIRAEVDADEHGTRGSAPRGAAEGRRRSSRSAGRRRDARRLQAGSPVSLAWKLTARPGTTVEMACL